MYNCPKIQLFSYLFIFLQLLNLLMKHWSDWFSFYWSNLFFYLYLLKVEVLNN